MASTEPPRAISTTSVVVAAQDQVSSDLAGEAVILSLQTGRYYGLDAVGSRIWELVRTPTRVAAIRDAILQQYDVAPDRCEHDVLNVLHQLAAEGLVEISDGTDP